jgi:uncharacterized SAM-binding protein YcdF (DUF218 family)
MSWLNAKFFSSFLLPPLNILLLGTIGLLLLKRRPFPGKLLIGLALVLLYFLSTPYFTARALNLIEPDVSLEPGSRDQAQAIVVLGAGTYFQAPDYDGSDTVNRLGLERLRYAAHLYRATAKPILVSGGKPQGSTISEAEQIKSVLVNEFRIPVTWEEPASNTTLESAVNCGTILKAAGINRVYLVTHGWHMRRAVLAFEAAGFTVIPAPTGFTTLPTDPLEIYLPNPQGLFESYIFMHEVFGWLWYKLKILVEDVF